MNTVTYYNGGTGVVIVTEADLDALLEELFAKPGLGIEDSAGLMDTVDYEGELQELRDGMDEEAWIRMGGC